MRALVVLFVVQLSGVAYADTATDSLARIEARFGYGAMMGGESGDTVVRASPFALHVRGSFALRHTPPLSAFVGLLSEVGDRTSAGVEAGAVLMMGKYVRAAGGARGILLPYMLFGPAASVGGCVTVGASLCLDMEVTFYVLGDDLPDNSVATQIQGVLSVGFDAL